MSDTNIYFVVANLFFIGMYLYQWEKNRKYEIEKEILARGEKKAESDATSLKAEEVEKAEEPAPPKVYALPHPRGEEVIHQRYEDPDVIIVEPVVPKALEHDDSLDKLKDSIKAYYKKEAGNV